MEQLQSHICRNICAFPHILGSPSSYMTLQLLHSDFPYKLGKFDFLFLSVYFPLFSTMAESLAATVREQIYWTTE
jgi:hypothetical protein